MSNCLFCKIIAGEIPSYRVYEDRDFLAFLDINPLNLGHTLVVPKKHYPWVIDVPNFGQYWEIAGGIAKRLKESLKADSLNFVTLGYEIPHAHIHVIPRFKNDALGMTIDWTKRKKLTSEELQKIATQLRGGGVSDAHISQGQAGRIGRSSDQKIQEKSFTGRHSGDD